MVIGFAELKNWRIDFKLADTFEEVKRMKNSRFDKLIDQQVEIEAFQYLINTIKSKGVGIKYVLAPIMQSYLKKKI